ncbi:hypothetical protein PAXRUDRAFT_165846, partial [Paxillus rubicundulus Ve08.2h10]
LDVKIGTLCGHSVHWLISAHKAINKPEIVKKAFLLCKAGPNNQFNLSFEHLSSPETLWAL